MMLPRRYTRLSRLPRTLLFDLLPALLLLWSIVEVISIRRALQASDAAASQAAHAFQPGEKVFISSIHLHDEPLLRAHWNTAVFELAQALGPANVFVSIYESNSYDDTKGALRELDDNLRRIGARTNIVLDTATREQELRRDDAADGWVRTPEGKREVRRISYLARLRNRTLQPLADLEKQGFRFDKVVFLNDVVFTAHDVLKLLATHSGHYAAACALDFKAPPTFYDTFALRDLAGHPPLHPTFPYFAAPASRRALKAGAPAPVRSCWNGLLAMDAAPFYTKLAPLRFRALPDALASTHLEASECCLVHADNPYSGAHGVFVNPAVRVAYNKVAYDGVNPAPGGGGAWVSLWRLWQGVWANRGMRVLGLLDRTRAHAEMVVGERVRAWEKRMRKSEPGAFCSVDEMQVLRMDGWAHV
ncbi:glycosyltransferase family 69 protein [Aplosporella prunicola CBS 121167]|uniref:Glycosyltransferase family 69 protein n=1 Tax=Aplosporella prunicola CBS 121167 TaxID=1176127 RepID=A0A6A6B7Z9_9PEZI|nr:glycosyltransferase family 69 protein [Aplosporella prunicola CBS 121167]KAF2139385.1 glycosyltransferase family 69 protein [Aplosporella prunicola CBS 121167]